MGCTGSVQCAMECTGSAGKSGMIFSKMISPSGTLSFFISVAWSARMCLIPLPLSTKGSPLTPHPSILTLNPHPDHSLSQYLSIFVSQPLALGPSPIFGKVIGIDIDRNHHHNGFLNSCVQCWKPVGVYRQKYIFFKNWNKNKGKEWCKNMANVRLKS